MSSTDAPSRIPCRIRWLARDTEDVGEELGKVEEFSVENAMDPVIDVCSLADKEVAQPNQLPEVAMMARHDPRGSDHPFEGQKCQRRCKSVQIWAE